MHKVGDQSIITNFGGNLRLKPRAVLLPRSEAGLLSMLHEYPEGPVRAIGALHSWSQAPVSSGVLVDLRQFDTVEVRNDGAHIWAEVGAGCSIGRLLRVLNQQRLTLPSVGLITMQALAGAASTGTHGSGRNSLSQLVQSARVVALHPETGVPEIQTICSGPDLEAVRCGLGCLGIITSLRIPVRQQYQVEEHFQRYDRLEDVLAAEATYDLQQFFLVPWRWDYFAQHRREVNAPRSMLAPLYRLYWSVAMDLGLHLTIRALARALPVELTEAFFRWILPNLVPQNWKVVDRSDRQLTMRHELFQHIESEIFFARSQLPEAIDWVTRLLQFAAGELVAIPREVELRLRASGLWEILQRLRGVYHHHYPLCVRRVLPDDALLSMSQGDEPRYAVSFVSYERPDRRDPFFTFADVLCRTSAALFDGRPHWGKYNPLPPEELARLYPRMSEFQQIQTRRDPQGRFLNDWLRAVFSAARTTAPAQPDELLAVATSGALT